MEGPDKPWTVRGTMIVLASKAVGIRDGDLIDITGNYIFSQHHNGPIKGHE